MNTTGSVTTVANTGADNGATAILGQANGGTAVYGLTTGGSVGAVVGRSHSGSTGVFGLSMPSDSADWPQVPTRTGVYGYANQDSSATGVAGASVLGVGVIGTSTSGFGIRANSDSSYALLANSGSSLGVGASSGGSNGVFGVTTSAGVAGILGGSANGTGVQGISNPSLLPGWTAPAKTGVHGYAAQDAYAVGVLGETTGGTGVQGVATTGTGVRGVASSGYAMEAISESGPAFNAVSTLETAVRALSTTATALIASSASGRGGEIESSTAIGLVATTIAADRPAFVGFNPGGTAILGLSDPGASLETPARANTAVHGYATIDATAVGVRGETSVGTGVHAVATTGVALKVTGKAQFSRSGRATVAAGHTSVLVKLAGVTTSSYVIATPQAKRAGVFVQAVVPAGGSFTIHLSRAPLVATTVGYLVIN